MDMDTTRGKDAHEQIFRQFAAGEANVLIGTQMIAKGLDFPNVTLVGVIAADMTLNLPDYRSAERTFQLLTQVAGRAGRADMPGHGDRADLRPGALRREAGGGAGLSRVLSARERLSPQRALSAVYADRAAGVFRKGSGSGARRSRGRRGAHERLDRRAGHALRD